MPKANPDLSLAATDVISVARLSDTPHPPEPKRTNGLRSQADQSGVKRPRLTSR